MTKNMLTQSKGFTLIEIMVTLGILVIVTSGASALLITSIRSNDTIWGTLTVQQDGRKVIQEIIDDVRRAEVSSIGSYPIVSANNNEFIFYANVDNDPDRERVSYRIEGENLYKGVIKPSGTPLRYISSSETTRMLATGVKNIDQSIPLFSYYDELYSGSEAALVLPTDVTGIRMVRVSLQLEQPKSKALQTLEFQSEVHIRNLKQN